MRRLALSLCCGFLVVLGGSCAVNTKAKKWSGLVGPDGEPVHLNSTTKVGFNAMVFFPFLGDIDLEGLVEDTTSEVRQQGGDYVRVVESRTDNYWYALPPVTWVVTPVVRSVTVEYRPEPQRLWQPPQESSSTPMSSSYRPRQTGWQAR